LRLFSVVAATDTFCPTRRTGHRIAGFDLGKLGSVAPSSPIRWRTLIRILSVSRDTSLLLSRNDALAIAGFSVVSPKAPEEAPQLLTQQVVDAVVIGHSIVPKERTALISAIRKVRGSVLLVFVFTLPHSGPEPLADLSVDVTEGPSALVKVLEDHLFGSGSTLRQKPRISTARQKVSPVDK
jgi:hypothetical protein